MLRRGTSGRIGVLLGLLALAACDRDDGDTTIAGDAQGDEGDGDGDGDDPAALVCADLNCGQDHTCVVPGLYCDRSGPEPKLTRDAPYCAPLAADPAVNLDDRALALRVQRLCPAPDVIISDDGRDGTVVRCPDLDVDPVCA